MIWIGRIEPLLGCNHEQSSIRSSLAQHAGRQNQPLRQGFAEIAHPRQMERRSGMRRDIRRDRFFIVIPPIESAIGPYRRPLVDDGQHSRPEKRVGDGSKVRGDHQRPYLEPDPVTLFSTNARAQNNALRQRVLRRICVETVKVIRRINPIDSDPIIFNKLGDFSAHRVDWDEPFLERPPAYQPWPEARRNFGDHIQRSQKPLSKVGRGSGLNPPSGVNTIVITFPH